MRKTEARLLRNLHQPIHFNAHHSLWNCFSALTNMLDRLTTLLHIKSLTNTDIPTVTFNNTYTTYTFIYNTTLHSMPANTFQLILADCYKYTDVLDFVSFLPLCFALLDKYNSPTNHIHDFFSTYTSPSNPIRYDNATSLRLAWTIAFRLFLLKANYTHTKSVATLFLQTKISTAKSHDSYLDDLLALMDKYKDDIWIGIDHNPRQAARI